VELTQFVRILRKRWWIVVVAVIVTSTSGFLFSRLQSPVYQATAEVVIQPARPDLGLTQSAKTLLRLYMTVVDSNRFASQVIDRLALDMIPERLRANAHFAAEDDRLVIRIEIEDTDPRQAADIARMWAQLVQEWRDSDNQRQRKEDRVYAELRDEPTVSQAWPPRTAVVLAAGVIFGVLVAGVVIFFLEWVESGIVRTPRDIEQWIGLTVLGTVPPSES